MYISLASVGRCIIVLCGLKCILLKAHFKNYILSHNYWFHCQIPHKWVFQFYQRPIHYSKVNTSCGDRKEVTPNLAQYVAFITIHVPLGLVRNDHSSVLGNVLSANTLPLFVSCRIQFDSYCRPICIGFPAWRVQSHAEPCSTGLN